ncbi:ABC transporter ATP-binding protein [Mycolicibacterium hodleri]|nr:ABC transporter ATP-binding protein [Mycolicibacterium hodleri]
MNPSPAPPAVRIAGAVKRFGNTVAVGGLDLQVQRGQVLALLGANGAGKTTTLEMCEGFTSPDRGEVRVLGLDPVADRDRLRPRIGVMLQGGGAYPGARTGEMLALAAGCARTPHDPRWLLQTLGLTGAERTPYRRLSGGQQQRLSLACALVGRPELVFLDEPTAGLDPQARHLVWELIDHLRDDGVSVLLTTHAMEEAEALADQVIIMHTGTVSAAGTPLELAQRGAEEQIHFTAPPHLNLAALRDALGTHYAIHEVEPGRYLVQGPIAPEVVLAVATWCTQQHVVLGELRVQQRRLEELFLDLTGREVRAG